MSEQDRLTLFITMALDIIAEQASPLKYYSREYRISRLTMLLLANNVTVPPVRAGQTVYIIRRPIDKPEWIDECVLENVTVEYTADGKTCRFKSHNFEATEKDIGAWVFLAREEAEKMLEVSGDE